MATIFDEYQLAQIVSAIDDGKGCQLDADGVYRYSGGPNAGALCGPSVTGVTPLRPDPPVIARVEQTPFDCPVPGGADCFERMPREDVTTVISTVSDDGDTQKFDVNLDNVRGMRLCSIQGFVTPQITAVPDGPGPDYQTAIDIFKFHANMTVQFRGGNVPGLTDIRLADLVSVAGDNCCTAQKLCVDCTIPQQGGLAIQLSQLTRGTQASDNTAIDWWTLHLELKFSGCGCNCGPLGCSCGGK